MPAVSRRSGSCRGYLLVATPGVAASSAVTDRRYSGEVAATGQGEPPPTPPDSGGESSPTPLLFEEGTKGWWLPACDFQLKVHARSG